MKEIFWNSVFQATTFKRVINSSQVLWSLACSTIFRKKLLSGLPFILNIEPTVLCNLSCPQCLTGLGKIKRNGRSLSFELFKKIIDEVGDKIWHLLLYNQGEPFLHDQLISLIHLAKKKRIYVMTSTNGHFLTETSAVEKLVNSGLDSIFISLDGISQFSYGKYRIGGKFNQVLSGIQLLVETKKKLAATTPKIVLQFLIMKHNQHEIKEIKKFKKKFKVDRVLIKTVQIENSHQALDFLPANQKYNRYHNIKNLFDLKNKKNKLCSRLWYSTVVLSDGRVVPCCFDKNGKHTFGDLSRQSITEIWNSDDYQQFREHSKRNRQSIDLCRNCTQNQKIYF